MFFVNGCVCKLQTKLPFRTDLQLTRDTAVTLGHIGTHVWDLTVEDIASDAFLLVLSTTALGNSILFVQS